MLFAEHSGVVRLAWTLPALLAGCGTAVSPPAAPSPTPRAYAPITSWPPRGSQSSDPEARQWFESWWSAHGVAYGRVPGERVQLLYLGSDGHVPSVVFLRTTPGKATELVLGRVPNAADCTVTCYWFCVAPLPPPGTPVSWYVPYHEDALALLVPPDADEIDVTGSPVVARDGLAHADTGPVFSVTVDGAPVAAPTFRHRDDRVDCAAT